MSKRLNRINVDTDSVIVFGDYELIVKKQKSEDDIIVAVKNRDMIANFLDSQNLCVGYEKRDDSIVLTKTDEVVINLDVINKKLFFQMMKMIHSKDIDFHWIGRVPQKEVKKTCTKFITEVQK